MGLCELLLLVWVECSFLEGLWEMEMLWEFFFLLAFSYVGRHEEDD